MTTPRANQRGGGRRKTGTSPFTPKQSLSLSRPLLLVFFSQRLSLSFSPNLSMPKIHRMKEERGRERRERLKKGGGVEVKRRIETKNLYLSKQMERRQRGTFLSVTRDIDMAPLQSFCLKEKQTNDSNIEMEEKAEVHVGVHKPKMTKDNFTK